jgi:hypothetical protein
VNISKIIEIPTLKAYAFLFLVSRNIWWYIHYTVGHDHMGWSCPQWTESALISRKPLRFLPINHKYPWFLCQGTSDGM